VTETSDADGDPDGEEGTVRLWLVERTYDSRNLVTIVYATPDGERYHQKEQSAHLISGGVTAAIEAEAASLAPVEDAETRERYADEVDRMRERHTPDETI
jgi:hypothetical protein